MKTFKQSFLCLLPILTALTFSACSGGGGGGEAPPPDTTTPVITSIAPANGATGVAVNTSISATFSEAMNPATIDTSTFTLTDSGNNPISGTVACSGTTVTFTPSAGLVFSTAYTATISSGVTDLAGNAMSGGYSWTFTTGIAPDTTPPAVTATTPANGATDVAVNAFVSATFSEGMAPATLNTSTFTVKDSDDNLISGTVTYWGTTASFTPNANLAFSAFYTATITAGARDLAGNALAGDHVWTFATGASATFTVVKSGTGSGTVTAIPAGIDCGADCTETYAYGTEVVLAATPEGGSVFEGFSGGCSSIEPTCALTLTGDQTVTAIFNTSFVSATGNQLSLNGADEVAVQQLTNNPPASPLDLSTFTIEAWVYPLADRAMLIAADSAYYLMVRSQPLRVEFAVMTSTGSPAFLSFSGATKPLELNQWNHVVGMVENSTRTLRVAVNGEISGTLTMGGSVVVSSTQTFSVGNSFPQVLGNYPFVGRIDEVRLSSSLRYSENFSPPSLLISDGNTLGLWHFDEEEGATTFSDSSGNGNTLTGLGGAAIIAGTREGYNSPPVANAGGDKNFSTGSTVTLDGSGSYDLNGDQITYSWAFTSKPVESFTFLSGATTAYPTFTADVDGSYVINLVVNDGTVDGIADSVKITALTPGAPTTPIPDTGQTTCYGESGNLISCIGSGQDGEYSLNPMSFADNLDETVSDNVTGLIWQQIESPSEFNWYEATGTADDIYNPGGFTNVCSTLTLDGHGDWRLPTKKELVSLVNYGTYAPAIETTYFPSAKASGYWSSSSRADRTSMGWYVDFNLGAVGTSLLIDKTYPLYVRCVRGTPPYSPNFAENNDGTVSDLNSGLLWQQNDDNIPKTWQQALAYCEELSLSGQSDWRLPNVKELESIVDDTQYNPAINGSYFPDTNALPHWSSTTDVYLPDIAWYVSFQEGRISATTKTYSGYVRCVR